MVWTHWKRGGMKSRDCSILDDLSAGEDTGFVYFWGIWEGGVDLDSVWGKRSGNACGIGKKYKFVMR